MPPKIPKIIRTIVETECSTAGADDAGAGAGAGERADTDPMAPMIVSAERMAFLSTIVNR